MTENEKQEITKKYCCRICRKKLTSISNDNSAVIIHGHFSTPEGIYCVECWEIHKTDYFKKSRKSRKTKEVIEMGKGKNKGTKETKKPKGGKKEK